MVDIKNLENMEEEELEEKLESLESEIKDLVLAYEKEDEEWISKINERTKKEYGKELSELEDDVQDALTQNDFNNQKKKYFRNLFYNIYLAKTKAEYRVDEETGDNIEVFYIDGDCYYWNMPYSKEIEEKMSKLLEERYK